MQILMLIENYLPKVGGAELHVFYLIKNLLSSKHKVELITGIKAIGGQNNGEICPVYRYKIPSEKILFLPFWIIRVYRHARNADVIHAHFSAYFAFVSVIVGRILKKRVIVTLHGSGTLESSVKKSVWRKLFRYISLKYADRIIATSAEMKEIALQFTHDSKMEKITNGVDTHLFINHKTRGFENVAGSLRLATLRRLVPKNGVHFVVDALCLAKDRLRYSLDIIGDGQLAEKINRKLELAGIVPKVYMHGVLQHEQVVKKLEEVDVVLFLSTAESTSLAALECMSMGCIVVSSNAGAFPDFIHDGINGFIVDIFEKGQSDYAAPETLEAWQYEKIIEKLVQIQNLEPTKLIEISKYARQFIEKNYEWQSIAEHTAKQYL